jgi:hypothetical protein
MTTCELQTVSPPPRIGSLTTVRNVREELARVYKDARRGVIETQDASRLAFILMTLFRVIEGGELEERMNKLEQAVKSVQGGTDNESNHHAENRRA